MPHRKGGQVTVTCTVFCRILCAFVVNENRKTENRNASRISPLCPPHFCVLAFLALAIAPQVSTLGCPLILALRGARSCEPERAKPQRGSQVAFPFFMHIEVRPTEGMGLAPGHLASWGQSRRSGPCCAVRKGGEVFSASRRRIRKAAAGPGGSEKRLLWGSSEHS